MRTITLFITGLFTLVPHAVCVVILMALMVCGSKAHADDEYYYASVSVGHFFKGYYGDYPGTAPDGQIPATVKLGRAWERGDWTYFGELRHRSNADLGWPLNDKSEYSREGLFVGARYSWGRR